ncbi:MAG: hypothetical protein HC848_02340 [Limnobacter sp.]|nr:hypothetical protein [Limnobacter sp.]
MPGLHPSQDEAPDGGHRLNRREAHTNAPQRESTAYAHNVCRTPNAERRTPNRSPPSTPALSPNPALVCPG